MAHTHAGVTDLLLAIAYPIVQLSNFPPATTQLSRYFF